MEVELQMTRMLDLLRLFLCNIFRRILWKMDLNSLKVEDINQFQQAAKKTIKLTLMAYHSTLIQKPSVSMKMQKSQQTKLRLVES
jgi:hypothetical protein